jgi:hypothetical protein
VEGDPLDIPVTISLGAGEHPVATRTRMTGLGAYVLVLDTVLPVQGVELHSTYTGHPKVKTLSCHLMLAHGLHDTLTVEHDHASIPVIHERRACLYDHLQRLQDLLAQLGHQAHIPLQDSAIETVEH